MQKTSWVVIEFQAYVLDPFVIKTLSLVGGSVTGEVNEQVPDSYTESVFIL